MRTLDLITWCAAGVALVAVVVVAWYVWRARKQARQVMQQVSRVGELATAVEGHAEQASEAMQRAHGQAKWAWEQVKLAGNQVEEARQEHRASARAEKWEWAYALTKTARELVEASQELIRIAFDPHVAPHYRLAADRHYRQACQRWQDTVIKAVARASPPLDQQQQVITFAHVHHRLHGQIEVVLRAAETNTLAGDTALAQQVFELRQELASANRQLQRSVSANLTTAEDDSRDAATEYVSGTQTGASASSGSASSSHPAAIAAPHGQRPETDGARTFSTGTAQSSVTGVVSAPERAP